MNTPTASTLTQHEWPALARDTVNLADAHARHSLSTQSVQGLAAILEGLLAKQGSNYFEAEEAFRAALSGHTGQQYGTNSSFLTYSASIALDAAAKQLLPQRRPIGLLTPTFDSVPALFRRSGLHLTPVPERRVLPAVDLDYLDGLSLGALIVVVPNNPTGTVMFPDQVIGLLGWAARRGVTLVLDLSFRMFDPGLRFDVIESADGIGAQVLTVDDTGKTIPLYDTKLGVLSASRTLAQQTGRICGDILLNLPELDLRMLGYLFGQQGPDAEVARACRIAAANGALLAELSAGGTPRSAGGGFQPTVAWLHCDTGRDHIVESCRRSGVALLPGDRFFWDRSWQRNPGSERIRVPLLRDEKLFEDGMRTVFSAARDVCSRVSMHADGEQ
ncbi:aminotransferase class I/II-fold pyridoxal phosphate-dependent enzyme [Streptomyces sp. NBC_01478]|uniref:aminotransferase class I/II-fold pyridoxal phosphate-dependent enzyme n=1 Tax=Streptomyces sp. NBC_01478 TaxID=2903882 RepID=UPI002E33F9EF|nr:aminotransferase class I/II-fold pyridoxal phosphate-dependent enzyme [Streptomyces sp. NBC_01478]